MCLHAVLIAGELGDSALSVSAFYVYGWLDWIKSLLKTVGLDPHGILYSA